MSKRPVCTSIFTLLEKDGKFFLWNTTEGFYKWGPVKQRTNAIVKHSGVSLVKVSGIIANFGKTSLEKAQQLALDISLLYERMGFEVSLDGPESAEGIELLAVEQWLEDDRPSFLKSRICSDGIAASQLLSKRP